MVNYQKRCYKRIELRKGHSIALTNKDIAIIDAIGEVLEENYPKISLSPLKTKVREKLGKKGWGINDKINYCLMILYIKKKISIKNCIKPKQTQWRTWIWFPKNSKKLNLRHNYGMY